MNIWSTALVALSLGLGPHGLGQPAAEKTHASVISGWNRDSYDRGEKHYQTICVTCHGTPEREGSLPTSRPFWKEPFKNGGDPFSIYKTIGEGLGQMPAWPWLEGESRYDIIHFIREAFLKPHNREAYFEITPAYLAGLPKDPLPKGDQLLAAELKTPRYLKMDFGPSLNWTYEVASNNIAYKGIAIRLDGGRGGVSKGQKWLLYDHDTMRVAAGWRGDSFVDWKGIAFDGSHQTHTRIVGEHSFENPVGPGWADPETGSFDDPRMRGRDGKPYGPLPRQWAHFRGLYHFEDRVILRYTVGDAEILEMPGYAQEAFTRTLNIGKSSRDLLARVAPVRVPVSLSGTNGTIVESNDWTYLRVQASATPAKLKIILGRALLPSTAEDLEPMTKGGAARWNLPMETQVERIADSGPFTVDYITHPSPEQNPWQSWMRLGGFDFFAEGNRAAVCTWMGEVWLVSGLRSNDGRVQWKRIAAGLFQPLGLKIVEGRIYVTCRDQIVRLHDLNGDEEIDYYENFNNDHQVTEHFHEFAMGLQTDREGNFYYAKSARHALPAVVPHHGTLLKVSRDGARTEILATGFRAANGVCVNEDGTFFVTDQEGHWIPKNRINWVRPGGFYGNMMGYHDRTSSSDADMEQPVVWITNEMDRSPGELLRVTSEKWGPLRGGLLNLSYGTGRIFLVLNERVNGQLQGGVVQLPIPDLPTGVMRGRFHPQDGQLYACGLFAWAGNRTEDGGFYLIGYTGKPLNMPAELQAHERGLTLRFSDPLDRSTAENTANYGIKMWDLKRSSNYGSKHHNERQVTLARARLGADERTLELDIPDIRPTWSMEIRYELVSAAGEPVKQTIHNTIHQLGNRR